MLLVWGINLKTRVQRINGWMDESSTVLKCAHMTETVKGEKRLGNNESAAKARRSEKAKLNKGNFRKHNYESPIELTERAGTVHIESTANKCLQ